MTSDEKSNSRQKKISRSAIARPYRIVSYVSLMLFVGLIAYMIYFQVYQSEDLLNSPYNKRQEEAEEQIVRGSILASDRSTILAETTTDENGEETRTYPYGSLFAHTVGYQIYGGSGLESTQNSTLIQSHSSLVTQVQNDLDDEKKQGDNLITTFDVSLQQTASDALGGMSGAVIVMDIDTGEILVDVSSPTYDPNTVEEDWDTLTTDDTGVFMNRAMQGLYAPGSTFKMVTALAYLRQYGTFDGFSYSCSGTYTYSDFTIHCSGYAAHGDEDFEHAMANSCNCAFAYMAVNLIDKDVLRETAESLGFNEDLDLELPYTASEFTLDADTADQLTMQTAIGQGETLATPMQMCMITDAIANGGLMMEPAFVDSVVSADGRTVSEGGSVSYGQVMTAEEASALKEVLSGVTSYGTASALSSLSYNIIGKTGTAEYGDVSDGTAHSWFTGFSNTGGDDIVVTVLVEGGGNGVYSATTVAGTIFQAYFG